MYDVTVSPSTVSSQLNIILPEALDKEGTLYISDLNKRVLMRITIPKGTQKKSVNVSGLKSGHYVVTMKTISESEMARFVKT